MPPGRYGKNCGYELCPTCLFDLPFELAVICRSACAHLHGWSVRAPDWLSPAWVAGLGALHPPPHRFLLPAMIGGNDTTEFLREVDDEVIFTGGAAAAGHDDSDPILEGLDECVDAFTPRFDGFRTTQPLSELDPDVEDDDDDSRDSSAGEHSERDDNDDDDGGDAALMGPFTGDAPADLPLRGGEAPGTAAALARDSR